MTAVGFPRTSTPGGAIADTIRVELHRRRATHRQLAAAVGWTPATCSRRLNGTAPLTVDELFACAEFLELPVDELLALAAADLAPALAAVS